MSESRSDDAPVEQGTAELELALIAVEAELDRTFGAAERSSTDGEEGTGLILEQLLVMIRENLSGQIPCDRMGLAIVEDDGVLVRSRWARAHKDGLRMGSRRVAPFDHPVVREILSSGEPMIVNDLETYLEEHADSEPIRSMVEAGTRSSLTCPLIAGGKPIGLMVFSSEQPGAYEERHAEMFHRVAAHLATILERSRLYERLGELNWQLRVARDALEYQATHDGLTRLLNRTAILELAERELKRAQRQGKPITIVMCDIDHFKAVNDRHGHLVGDVVLQEVADRLQSALRSYETVGRYGGEEFLITLYDCSADDAPKALERLRTAIDSDGIETEAGTVEVTISLGAAVGTGGNVDIDDFIRVADEAMYEAKEAGRNRHRVRTIAATEGNGEPAPREDDRGGEDE